jgi:hypothetical protein
MLNEFKDENIVLVVSDAYVLNGEEIMLDTFYDIRDSGPGFVRNIIKNSFIGCCMAFRNKLKVHILPFPQSIPMHDQWIGLMAERNGTVKFIPDRLIIYRRHSNNVTQLDSTNLVSIVKKRISLVKTFYEYHKYKRETI